MISKIVHDPLNESLAERDDRPLSTPARPVVCVNLNLEIPPDVELQLIVNGVSLDLDE
jgi:hypothetical protein